MPSEDGLVAYIRNVSARWFVALALAVTAASCGDDGGAGDGGAGPDRDGGAARDDGGRAEGDGGARGCEPERARPIAGALGLERALIERGREDADLAAMLGDDGAALFDRADELRTKLVEEAARDQALELVDPEQEQRCTDGGIAASAQPLSVASLIAFALTGGQLAAAASSAPFNGMTPSHPYMSEERGTADDGTPTQTFITLDIITSGRESTVTVKTTVNTSLWKGNARITETATMTASIDVCPDAGGVAAGSVSFVIEGSSSDGASYRATIDDTFALNVNDAARIASTDVTSRIAYRASGANAADVAVHGSASFAAGSYEATNVTGMDDRFDGSEESRRFVRDNLYKYGTATAAMVQSAAESKWRGGTCVEITPDPASQMVDADAQLTLKATARHKFEMAELRVPIVATLSGVQALSPNMPVMSPASFQYTAGSAFKDKGTIEYKTTSRRGIGTASATVEVKCDEDMMCPSPQELNVETCECECPERESCSGGRVWDEASCECVCEMTCPSGQTLDPDTCQCEAGCDIHPTLFNAAPAQCMLAGTLTVSADDGGEHDEPGTGGSGTHWVWSHTYLASLTVDDTNELASPVLFGSISGDWQLVETATYGAPASCTTTRTEMASIDTSLNGEGAIAISSTGTSGSFQISAFFGVDKTNLNGTETFVDSGGACESSVDPSPFMQFGPSVSVMATADGPNLRGSTTVPGPFAPGDGESNYEITWDLQLVHR